MCAGRNDVAKSVIRRQNRCARPIHVGTNSKLRRLAKSKCKTSSSVDRHEFLCGHDGRQKWVYLEGFRVQHPNA